MKKKIAFCINSMSKGGAERVVSIIANNISKDMDVTIIILTKNDISYNINSDVKIIEISKKKNTLENRLLNKVLLPFKVISRVIKLKKVFNKNKYDLIITFLPEASFMAFMANKGKSKIILSERNEPNVEYQNKVYKYLAKKYFPRADGFVFQTDDAKKYFDDFIDFSNRNYDVIYNPVDSKFITKRYEGKRKKEIVSVGRLEEQKNFDLLIDTFNEIHKKYPDYRLIIYGEGSLRKKYENKIQEYGLKDYIKLPGVTDDVKEKIYDSKLFVMTSNFEGMPNALIEAMCLGLTCISTDCPCGGPKMLIQNKENGILIDLNNKEQLCDSIDLILSNPTLCEEYGKSASQIADKVNVDNVIKKWKNIIENVLEEKNGKR